jgi:hypothetical protein
LDLLGSELPGSATESQEETEYRRTAPVGADGVEAGLLEALKAWREGDVGKARKALLKALIGLA